MAEPHRPSCALSIRRCGVADGWSEPQIAQAIHDHCGVSVLRAFRLAHGWTLSELVIELRSAYVHAWGSDPALSHQRVSQWEKGADTPSPKYLDALCRVYRSRPDLLGFGSDYGADPDPPTTLATGNEMLSQQLLESLQAVRARADALLETQSVCAATVDRWEILAEEYGSRRLSARLDVSLAETTQDFGHLCDILSQRQPIEFQVRLYRVMAKLAGLIGLDMGMGAGALRESRTWFHTARLAAEEVGDRHLRGWLAALEGQACSWDPSLAERAIGLCQTAQAMAGSAPRAAGALAASIEARIYARRGCRRDALGAIHRSEAMFERLSQAERAATLFGYNELRLRYDQQNILTRLGDYKAATGIQEQVLALTDANSAFEYAMIQLDRANCLISANELEEGCHVAHRALLDAPDKFIRGVLLFRAREVDQICRARQPQLTSANDLHRITILNRGGYRRV